MRQLSVKIMVDYRADRIMSEDNDLFNSQDN